VTLALVLEYNHISVVTHFVEIWFQTRDTQRNIVRLPVHDDETFSYMCEHGMKSHDNRIFLFVTNRSIQHSKKLLSSSPSSSSSLSLSETNTALPHDTQKDEIKRIQTYHSNIKSAHGVSLDTLYCTPIFGVPATCIVSVLHDVNTIFDWYKQKNGSRNTYSTMQTYNMHLVTPISPLTHYVYRKEAERETRGLDNAFVSSIGVGALRLHEHWVRKFVYAPIHSPTFGFFFRADTQMFASYITTLNVLTLVYPRAGLACAPLVSDPVGTVDDDSTTGTNTTPQSFQPTLYTSIQMLQGVAAAQHYTCRLMMAHLFAPVKQHLTLYAWPRHFGGSHLIALMWHCVQHALMYKTQTTLNVSAFYVGTSNDAAMIRLDQASMRWSAMLRWSRHLPLHLHVCVITSEWETLMMEEANLTAVSSKPVMICIDNAHELTEEQWLIVLRLSRHVRIRMMITGLTDTVIQSLSLCEIHQNIQLIGVNETRMYIVYQNRFGVTLQRPREFALSVVYTFAFQPSSSSSPSSSNITPHMPIHPVLINTAFYMHTNVRIRATHLLPSKVTNPLVSAKHENGDVFSHYAWLPLDRKKTNQTNKKSSSANELESRLNQSCALRQYIKITMQKENDAEVDKPVAKQIVTLLQEESPFALTLYL